MRRLLTGLLIALALAAPAHAQERERRYVDVVEVSGLVDRVVVDFVRDALARAADGEAEALVIQLDSGGAVVDRDAIDALAAEIARSPVPVGVWVGPSGSRARDEAVELVRAAHVAGVAPGASIGGEVPEVLQAPTLGDFIVDLDGEAVAGRTLETSEVVREPGQDPRRRPTVDVRFSKLGLLPRLLHTAASPSVAYVLFVTGLALVVFELYTAGIGVAAVVGVLFLALAGFGLAELPTRLWAVGLLGLGVAGYAVDVQAGAPRAWTVIGTVSLAVGTIGLYDGVSSSWVVRTLVVAGVALFMVAGMPSMVRARFATPTIGRESMVGEVGAALVDVAPEGTVEVRGAPWRARTNRATPITAGEPVRVVGIDGLLLEVEPPDGGARDHRRH
ncbi:MAG TPA: NfeD family protein [Acidimicrobiales bacterium]|nr:NfeD family protein [Acidimicrobiales bacterium]